jgi:tetratricopeptide (TPR) repeat protein/CHAT domain-containing protein
MIGALSVFFSAAALAHDSDDKARDLYMRALAHVQSGHEQEAIEEWSQALTVFRTIPGSERHQADCHKNLGTALQNLGRGKESAAHTRQALALYKRLPGTVPQQACCCQNLGWVLNGLNDYEESMAQMRQALTLYQTLPGTERDRAACTGAVGLALKNLGRYEAALEQHQQALKLFQALPESAGAQADCHNNLGGALSGLGKHEEAIAQFQQSLVLYRRVQNSERAQARGYQNIGEALRNLSRYDQALEFNQQALELLQARPDAERERAECFSNIGLALSSLGKYEEARGRFHEALGLFMKFRGAERDQADCRQNLGVTLSALGKQEEAMAQTRQALQLYQTLPSALLEQARCYQNLGVSQSQLCKLEESAESQRQALRLYQTLQGTERDQADCYNNCGTALRDLGQYEEATAHILRALRLYQALPNTERQQAGCHGNMGTLLMDLGKHEEARSQIEKTLELFRRLQHTEAEQAGCRQNLGGILLNLGEYEEAIAQAQEALPLYQRRQGTEREQARCHLNLGGARYGLGQYEEAERQHRLAMKLFQPLQGTARDQQICWGNIGRCLLGAERFSEAIEAFGQTGDTVGLSVGLSQAYRRRGLPGDDKRALQQLLRATEWAESVRATLWAREHREGIFERVGEAFPEVTSLLAELSGQRVVSEEPAAVRWARDSRSPSAGWEAAFHFADQGKGRSLDDALRERSALKSSRTDAKLLTEDKELARQIGRLTAMRDAAPTEQTGRKKELTRDTDELQQRRNVIEVELKKTALGGYVAPAFRTPMETAADLEPDTAVLQYSVGEKTVWLLLLTRAGVTGHKLDCMTRAWPELKARQRADIGPLVEAWQARPAEIGLDGLVRLARERAEDQGREVKQNRLDATSEQAILLRLGDAVLPPAVLAELRKKAIRHLLVIPDGSLHDVPFAMIRIAAEENGAPRYVLEEFSVSYTPAMTTLETVRKQRRERERTRTMERRQLLAFANPDYGSEDPPAQSAQAAGDDMVTRMRHPQGGYYASSGLCLRPLPDAEQEAKGVASLFGSPTCARAVADVVSDADCLVLTAKAASEEHAKQLLGAQSNTTSPRWKHILFSTHGLADTQNGMLSCVALAASGADTGEDGFLYAHEVLDLDLDADLVMLSACQTGLGRRRGGEGLVGLSGAFFVAGAESVSASLWSVPSGPTRQLVTEFFKRLKAGGVGRAEALRQAQLTVLRNGLKADGQPADYTSPFCWAAFVLMGEYRAVDDRRSNKNTCPADRQRDLTSSIRDATLFDEA